MTDSRRGGRRRSFGFGRSRSNSVDTSCMEDSVNLEELEFDLDEEDRGRGRGRGRDDSREEPSSRSRSMSLTRTIGKLTGRSSSRDPKKKRRGKMDDELDDSCHTVEEPKKRSSKKKKDSKKRREKTEEATLNDSFGGHDSMDSLFQFDPPPPPPPQNSTPSGRERRSKSRSHDREKRSSSKSRRKREDKFKSPELSLRKSYSNDDSTASMTSSGNGGRRQSRALEKLLRFVEGDEQMERAVRDIKLELLQQANAIEEQTDKVEYLEEAVLNLEDELASAKKKPKPTLLDKMDELDRDLAKSENAGKLQQRENKLKDREEELDVREKCLSRRETDVNKKEEKLETKRADCEQLDRRLQRQQKDLSRQELSIKEEQLLLKEERRQLEEDKKNQTHSSQDEDFRQKCEEYEEELSEMKLRLSVKDDEVDVLERTIGDLKKDLESMTKRVQSSSKKSRGGIPQVDEEEFQKLKQQNERYEKDLRRKEQEISCLIRDTEILRDEVELLEDEKEHLMSGIGRGDSGKVEELEMLQKEISEQLADLDEENQTLADRIAREEIHHEEVVREKDELIRALQDDLRGKRSEGRVPGLLKELNQLKSQKRSLELMQDKLDRALRKVEERDELIKKLQSQASDGKESENGDSLVKMDDLREERNKLLEQLKSERADHALKIKKKDVTISFMEKELVRERERKPVSEKQTLTKAPDGAESRRIEELEQEIDHWKAINCELENEMEAMKSEAAPPFVSVSSDDNDLSDDECSLRSMDHISMRSERTSDLLFLSDDRGRQPPSRSTSITSQQDPAGSARGGRSLGGIWSKLRAPPRAANPSIPYT